MNPFGPEITIGDIGNLLERLRKSGWIENGGIATEFSFHGVKYTSKGYERMNRLLAAMRSGLAGEYMRELYEVFKELAPPTLTLKERHMIGELFAFHADKHPENKCDILPFPSPGENPPSA